MLFDTLNRMCADLFSDGEVVSYVHFYGAIDSVQGIFRDLISEPTSPGPLTQISVVTSDFSSPAQKQDVIVRPNGDRYVVKEIAADNGGMTHLTLTRIWQG